MNTNQQDSGFGGLKPLSLAQKAKLIRSVRGTISQLARDLGKSKALVIRTLNGDFAKEANKPWVKTVMVAIDAKVRELLAAQRINNSDMERKPKPSRRPS
jgi:hypothetical protein